MGPMAPLSGYVPRSKASARIRSDTNMALACEASQPEVLQGHNLGRCNFEGWDIDDSAGGLDCLLDDHSF
jgi:hypothetical protein